MTAFTATVRPIRLPIVAGALIVTLVVGALAGNATASRGVRSPAPPRLGGASRPSTPIGRLEALGFTPRLARQLIRQLDTSVGIRQRVAAEQIASAAVWGTPDVFGASPLARYPHASGRLADV